ncbi:MAG: pyruvate formate lyase family protein [Promethearchaeota archaeon]
MEELESTRLTFLKEQLHRRTRDGEGHYRSFNEDAFLIQLGYNEARGDAEIIRWARGWETFFNECEVDILPRELIVGYFNIVPHGGLGVIKKDTAITGHFSVDYKLMLDLGIDGILKRIEHFRGVHREATGAKVDAKKEEFYDACRLSMLGFQQYILRYESVAREKLLNGSISKERRDDLERVVSVMKHIAHEPPSDLLEAVQLVVLFHMVIQLKLGCCSFGRPDRYLYPYYLRSIEEGATRGDIKEIIGAWFIKVNEFMDIPQSLMLGGQDARGNDASNELTSLMLSTMRALRVLNPAIGFSWNEETPDGIMEEIVETWLTGATHPAMFNDLTIIKGLERMGIEHPRAVNYVHCTCTEITPVGCSNIFVVADYINLAKLLLRAMSASNLAPGKGRCTFNTFHEFKEAFYEEFALEIRKICRYQAKQQEIRKETFGQPLVSTLIHDCLERGLDISRGGARYNFAYTQLVGMPTVTDSLLVIRDLVYNLKEMSLEEFSRVLDVNWEGYEALRLRIINKFPKWGNDNPDADALGVEIVDFYYNEVMKYKGAFKHGQFFPGFLCWVMHERFGQGLGATPDGRLAGTPVSNSIGAVAGRGKTGLTAICNSASKIDHVRGGGASSVLNLTIMKETFNNNEKYEQLATLIKTYFKNGGFQVQINLIDRNILKDAQLHPECYTDLKVKVAGYSATFIDLNKNLQDEIIERAPQ